MTCVSDNGTELTSMAILVWNKGTGVGWHYIQPGKPQQNAFDESFNALLHRRVPCHPGLRWLMERAIETNNRNWLSAIARACNRRSLWYHRPPLLADLAEEVVRSTGSMLGALMRL